MQPASSVNIPLQTPLIFAFSNSQQMFIFIPSRREEIWIGEKGLEENEKKDRGVYAPFVSPWIKLG